jgi:hypothetical protein
MPNNQRRDRPHFFLADNGTKSRYTSPRQGNSAAAFPRQRAQHAAALEGALIQAINSGTALLQARNPQIAGGVEGFHLEFELPATCADIAGKLGDKRGKPEKHIELLNVHPSAAPGKVIATVFVPKSKQDYYLKKVREYRDNETRQGNPKNQALVASIDTARIAYVQSFYTDEPSTFPASATQKYWWEVWVLEGREELLRNAAAHLNLLVNEHPLRFAEHTVFLVNANVQELESVIRNTNAVAELRMARDTPAFFMNMGPKEQRDWTDDLLQRVTFPNDASPAVCVLDGGCSRIHPLIAPVLSENDWQAYGTGWQPGDTAIGNWRGHGTEMAGLAIYGDLTTALASSTALTLTHRLETVKILPDVGANNPMLYGAITGAAVALAELQAPTRRRAICLAISAPGYNWHGRPSSWSAAIDNLAYGSGGDEANDQRLFVIAAGNVQDNINHTNYIDVNDVSQIENPSQAWNSLTVGACTEKTTITTTDYTGWSIIAPAGDMSPCNRTSTGIRKWPIKPDVVFEGGNLAINPSTGYGDCVDDLSLLTTFYRPNERLLTTTGQTSAATALVSRMAAQILAEKPTLRSETVRGLIVHSAEWTNAMRSRLPANPSKTDYSTLLGRYGYGVPDLDRALRSLENDVTMVIEGELQPFIFEDHRTKTRDLVLHQLPWPSAVLQDLGNTPVEMQITLSYFVEPNPGERGWTRHQTYASHGLRFDVKASTETVAGFERRINRKAREEEAGYQPSSAGSDNQWLIGQRRDRGSLHSDVWRGTAVDLAAKHAIAVYPVGGWWKEKPALQRTERAARYSLIVSLRAPQVQTDLYTPISTAIQTLVLIEA